MYKESPWPDPLIQTIRPGDSQHAYMLTALDDDRCGINFNAVVDEFSIRLALSRTEMIYPIEFISHFDCLISRIAKRRQPSMAFQRLYIGHPFTDCSVSGGDQLSLAGLPFCI